MTGVMTGRRALLAGAVALGLTPFARLLAQPRALSWTPEDKQRYAAFVPGYVSEYSGEIDCADLALRSLATFAGTNRLPLRLYDFDAPSGPFDQPAGRRRWIVYDPRRDDWQRYRDYIQSQLGAANVVENTVRIPPESALPGDLLMTLYTGTVGFSGHTRVLFSITHDAALNDYRTVRYEGDLPPAVPRRVEGLLSEVANLYEDSPRRWNFSQFELA